MIEEFTLTKEVLALSIFPSKSLACLNSDKRSVSGDRPDLTNGSIIEICCSNNSSDLLLSEYRVGKQNRIYNDEYSFLKKK